MSAPRPTTDLHLLDLHSLALARFSWDDRWAQALQHRPEQRREPRRPKPSRTPARRRPRRTVLIDQPSRA